MTNCSFDCFSFHWLSSNEMINTTSTCWSHSCGKWVSNIKVTGLENITTVSFIFVIFQSINVEVTKYDGLMLESFQTVEHFFKFREELTKTETVWSIYNPKRFPIVLWELDFNYFTFNFTFKRDGLKSDTIFQVKSYSSCPTFQVQLWFWINRLITIQVLFPNGIICRYPPFS